MSIREALESAREFAADVGADELLAKIDAALRELDAAKPDAIRTAIAEEREACLDICNQHAADNGTAQAIAAAIRARGSC